MRLLITWNGPDSERASQRERARQTGREKERASTNADIKKKNVNSHKTGVK